MAKNKPETPEKRSLLFYSFALCLQNCGFSKTLKRFLSEAQIKEDDWKARALNLEDIFSKYLMTCNEAQTNFDPQRDQVQRADSTVGINEHGNSAASEEIVRKQKKKKNSDNKDNDSAIMDSAKISEEMRLHDKVSESNAKSKKEKNKKTSDTLVQSDEKLAALKQVTDGAVCETPVNESTRKQKEKTKTSKLTSEVPASEEKGLEIMPKVIEDKYKDISDRKGGSEAITESKDKKKKKMLKKDSLLENGEECSLKDKSKFVADKDISNIVSEQNKVQAKEKKRKKEDTVELFGLDAGVLDGKNPINDKSKKKSVETVEGVADENKMPSKKRKRLVHVDNEIQPVEQGAVEELKRRKTEGKEESNGVEKQVIVIPAANGKVFTENKEENVEVGESTNGNPDKNGVEMFNSSAEPKTQNAFQRVKVDEVKFVHEKLQDNSYWAKDGAENGYGAKAQEILGQVRGRDFRHEKTKKKRGTYRGGQIDLHSHSIKFNYSDEE